MRKLLKDKAGELLWYLDLILIMIAVILMARVLQELLIH
jgi:hypothetical protein